MVYLFTTLSLLLFRAALGASNAKALDDALASSRSKQPNINLHRAANAKDGRVRYCKQALADGAELDAQHPISKQTALMGAVLAGNDRIVAYLLGRGADAGVPEKDGYTPMHGAGFQGRAAVARTLLAHGISPAGTPHRDGFLPIHRACWGAEQRHADTVRALRGRLACRSTYWGRAAHRGARSRGRCPGRSGWRVRWAGAQVAAVRISTSPPLPMAAVAMAVWRGETAGMTGRA